MGCFDQTFSSRLRELCRRGAGGNGGLQGNNVFRTQQDSQRLWRPVQVQTRPNSSTEKGRRTQSPTPDGEAICSCYPVGKGKASVCSTRVSVGIPNTLQADPKPKPTPKGFHGFSYVWTWAFCLALLFVVGFFSIPLDFRFDVSWGGSMKTGKL